MVVVGPGGRGVVMSGRGMVELQWEVMLALRRGVRPGKSVGWLRPVEGSSMVKDGTRCRVEEGVVQSGERMELAVMVSLEMPGLLVMDNLRGEHLMGDMVEVLEGVPKLSLCFGTSVGLNTCSW